MTEDLFFEFWIELAKGFGFVEIAVTGFFFFLALGASGKLFSNIFNMMNLPIIWYEQERKALSKIISFFQGWLFSAVIFLIVGLMSIMFFFYGLFFSYLIGSALDLFHIQQSFNRESSTVGIALALFLGNSASVVRALSKKIRWLELVERYPNDYEKQSELYKLEKFNQIDL